MSRKKSNISNANLTHEHGDDEIQEWDFERSYKKGIGHDSIPFQRLESPQPQLQLQLQLQPQSSSAIANKFNFVSLNNGNEHDHDHDYGHDYDNEHDIEDDGSEPFASLDNDSDNNGDGDGDGRPRPPSQNSIANVLKHSFHEAKQMMHLCGVGVGELSSEQHANAHLHSHSYSQRTSSSNSLPLHFAKVRFDNEEKRANAFKQIQQQQQQQQQMATKQAPFPLSVYPSTNSPLDSHSYQRERANSNTIPLRHSQSVPFRPEPIMPHLFMRRSASTPTTFKLGNGRSAFGKVDVNTTILRDGAATYSSPTTMRKNVSASCMSDGKCQSLNQNRNYISSNVENDIVKVQLQTQAQVQAQAQKQVQPKAKTFNLLSLPTPTRRWLSDQTLNKTKVDDDRSPSKDPLALARVSNDDVSSIGSSAYSKSNIMNSKTQRKIKERRKERMKLQSKHKVHESSSSHVSLEEEDAEDKLNYSNIILQSNVDRGEKGNVSYVYLDADTNPMGGELDDDNFPIDEDNEIDFRPKPITKKAESPTPIPQPAYHKIVDDEHPSPSYSHANPPLPFPHHRRISSRTPPSPIARVATPPSNPSDKRLVLKGNTSPCSYDSASYSRTSRSGQSLNTSFQTTSTSNSGNVSCNRSVTSSVAEADREVRETNRRELKRREGRDLDGCMSIQSSDTTSTHAYLALRSSPVPLREGANIHYDRFFSNNSIGPATSQSSNASSIAHSWNPNQHVSSPGMNSRNPASVNVRSPITVSSNSISYTNSSTSNSEDPPRFVSCSSKSVPANTNRGDMPPRSDQNESSMGYSKLGSSKSRSKSRSSSRSSSSKSKSSKSKKKEKLRMYHKIGSAKVADQYIRASTPSPCNSFQTSSSAVMTPITPPNHFDYPSELPDVPKPRVHRQLPGANVVSGSKLGIVSPIPIAHEIRKDAVLRPTNFCPPSIHDHRAFRPAVILESVVTPEKVFNCDDNSHESLKTQ